jgi:hypothetical protein
VTTASMLSGQGIHMRVSLEWTHTPSHQLITLLGLACSPLPSRPGAISQLAIEPSAAAQAEGL